MLQDAHSRKIKEGVTADAGDTVLIAAGGDHWNYIHELIGDLDGTGTVSVLAIDGDDTEHLLAGPFDLEVGQGLTLDDEPGEDNRPRFEFNPDQRAVLRVVGATFNGAMDRSIRY